MHLLLRSPLQPAVVPGQPHGSLCGARLGWLQDKLEAAPDVPTVGEAGCATLLAENFLGVSAPDRI